MKTKFILSAMCLPVAFAACTNDEVFVENQNAVEETPVMDFKLAASYGDEGVGSRMVNNNGNFLWENTDVLGASLIYGSGDPFAYADNIYSNNKFVNNLAEASEVAEFTTQSTTHVGSYLFYYPYNTKMTTHANGVHHALVEPQVYDPTGEEMMKNNFMISPVVKLDGNEPGELTLPITMRSIYGYGQLNLKLTENSVKNGVAVTSANIQKIIISYTSNLQKDGIIDMSEVPVADLTSTNISSLTATGAAYAGQEAAAVRKDLLAKADSLLVGRKKADNTYYPIKDVTTAAAGQIVPVNQVSISCVSEENPNGIALNLGDVFSTRVLLPVASAATVDITVYTDKGEVVLDNALTSFNVRPNHKTVLASGDNTELPLVTFTPSQTVNAISEADFIASMAQFEGVTDAIPVAVGDFDLTPAAIAAIPSGVTLSFTSNVKFSGDMTLEKMSFVSGKTVTLKSGNITLGKNLSMSSDLNIEGAAVTKTADMGTPVVNVKSGSLTLSTLNAQGAATETVLGQVTVGTANTSGTLTVNKGITSNVTLTKGTLTVATGATVSSLTTTGGTVENNGTITTINNAGTVNNYGVISTGSNSGTMNQMDAKSRITLTTNTGTINTVASSRTTVTTNTSGKIIFVKDALVSASANVIYNASAEFTAADFVGLSASVTNVMFANDFTYTYTGETAPAIPAAIKVLEFAGNLTLGKAWTLNAGSTIKFTAEEAKITGSYTLSNVKIIEAGVADVTSTDANEAVATSLFIGLGTTINGLETVNLLGGAEVWNEGVVNSAAGTTITEPDGWTGAPVVDTPASQNPS